MTRRKISSEQISFISDAVFDFARPYIEGDIADEEINSIVVNVTMSNGISTGMFLDGYEYLMTVDKNALTSLN